MNRLNGEKSEECAEKPQTGKHGHSRALPGEAAAAEDQTLSHRDNNQEEKNNIDQTGGDAKWKTTPMRGDAPESAVPEALRKIQHRQDAQSNRDAEQQKVPIHGDGAPSADYKFTMQGQGILHDGGDITA